MILKRFDKEDLTKRLKAKSTDPSQVDALIASAQNSPNSRIDLNGKKLKQLGIPTAQFKTIKDLAQKFALDTGIKVNFKRPISDVDCFFVVVMFEKMVSELSGFKVQLELISEDKINFWTENKDHEVWGSAFKAVEDLLKKVGMKHELQRIK